MRTVLESLSVVILARDVNLSILKPVWLLKNGIFIEEELQGKIVFTPVNVLIATDNWEFTALPDRMQLRFMKEYPGVRTDISRTLGSLVKTLPHTPYTAAGLNFDYLFGPESQNAFTRWNQRLFRCPCSNEMALSDSVDPRFGAYVSFDTLGMRLRADIKPVKAPNAPAPAWTPWQPGEDLMRANLNFQADVVRTGMPAETVLATIERWQDASEFAKKIIAGIHD